MATFCSAAGKKRKVKETFARCVSLERHFQDRYQQYWLLNNLVKLPSKIEAVKLSRLEHRANNARVESSSLSVATFCSAAGEKRKVKETFARCV